MGQYALTLSDEQEAALERLSLVLRTRTPQEGMRRALAVAELVARHAVDGIASVRTQDGRTEDIFLPHDPRLKLALGNAALRDRHKGERCFIVACGPSLSRLDLSPLAGETVISLSRAYDMEGFERIAPRYHCLPTIVRSVMTPDRIAEFFRDMDAKLGGAELFLSADEEPVVREYGLFNGRDLRYVVMDPAARFHDDGALLPLTEPAPLVQSAPVMALLIAMHLGFRSIYLLGADHDEVWTRSYHYPFTPSFRIDDPSVDDSGRVTTSTFDLLQNYALLWRQYRMCRTMAEVNGIKIYNATGGGALDEFERVDLASLFEDAPGPLLNA